MTHKIHKVQGYLLVADDKSKVLAHLPLDGYPVKEGVPLLPPYSRHQEECVDALAEYHWKMKYIMALDEFTKPYIIEDFKAGYNKAREKYKYTEEDMRKAIDMATTSKHDSTLIFFNAEEILQSIHQYPTEFECEMEDFEVDMGLGEECIEYGQMPQKITTAQGVQWVGKYK